MDGIFFGVETQAHCEKLWSGTGTHFNWPWNAWASAEMNQKTQTHPENNFHAPKLTDNCTKKCHQALDKNPSLNYTLYGVKTVWTLVF